MQEDDGVRGWSNDTKTENKKYGGGPSSWWLKEESGGGNHGKEGENHQERESHAWKGGSENYINAGGDII